MAALKIQLASLVFAEFPVRVLNLSPQSGIGSFLPYPNLQGGVFIAGR